MAADNNNTPDSGDSGRRRQIAYITALLLLAVALAGAWFYYNSTSRISDLSTPNESTGMTNSRVEIGPMIDIREFIVNIISEDNSHYLRTSMTIELSNQDAYDEMNLRMPQIRDTILMLASGKTFEELYDIHGKKQLKAELLIEINEMLTKGEAVAVYFTDFVVQ